MIHALSKFVPLLVLTTAVLSGCGVAAEDQESEIDGAGEVAAEGAVWRRLTGTSTYGSFRASGSGLANYWFKFTNFNPDFSTDRPKRPGLGIHTMTISYRISRGAWKKVSYDLGPTRTGSFPIPNPVAGKHANFEIEISWATDAPGGMATFMEITCRNGKDPQKNCR